MTHYLMGTGSRSMRTAPDVQEIFAITTYYVKQKLIEHPDLILISGMAEGFDECIAQIGIRNNIPWIAAVPNYGYGEYYWGRKSVTGEDRLSEYQAILGQAIDIHFICEDQLYINGVHANMIRNSWMVEKCSEAAVYLATSPGTRDAVAKLRAAHKPLDFYPFTEGTHE